MKAVLRYCDISAHALQAAHVARDVEALQALKLRILEDGKLFLSSLEKCAAELPENRVETVERAYAALEQIRLQPLEWFADYWDYDQRRTPQTWKGQTITAGMLGAASLIKMHGKIGK